MKQYQVVTVSGRAAWRNNKRLYFDSSQTQSLADVMEIIMNWYAKDGWVVAGMVSTDGDVHITFEK